MNTTKGWIGVDLDATLAYYDGWKGENHIGAPIPLMLQRVKDWLAEGKTVKIFTARVSAVQSGDPRKDKDQAGAELARKAIEAWCLEHVGQVLEVTCVKDYGMIALWDDRAVRVEENTGVVR